ncbi:MAG: RidA family protein [Bacteroidota bacterium]
MNKEIINSALAPAPIGPYNQAVKVGNLLFVSGQIAIDQASGNLIQESIEIETEQVMKNLSYILAEAGSDFSKVVKTSIFINDMNNFAKINEVYATYMSEPYPARETVEVSKLPKNVNVEISVIALI